MFSISRCVSRCVLCALLGEDLDILHVQSAVVEDYKVCIR